MTAYQKNIGNLNTVMAFAIGALGAPENQMEMGALYYQNGDHCAGVWSCGILIWGTYITFRDEKYQASWIDGECCYKMENFVEYHDSSKYKNQYS